MGAERSCTAVRYLNGYWYGRSNSTAYPIEVLAKDKATFDECWAWACTVQDFNIASMGKTGISVSVTKTT